MSEKAPAIVAENLVKRFGELTALDGVSFHVEPGEIFGLLGPNGAGKTTAISILSGLLSPDGGTATVAGHRAGDRKSRAGLGVAPQDLALYEDLSAAKNLAFFGAIQGLRGRDRSARAEKVLELVGLRDRASDRVETFSGGMKRRLNLAVALIHDPDVLLLDEPTVGVDPQSRAHLFETIADMAARGKAILYTTHYMEEAERLCKHISIVDHGKVLREGTLHQLLASLERPNLHRFRVDEEAAEKASSVLGEGAVKKGCDEEGDTIFEAPGESSDLPERLASLDRAGVAVKAVEVEKGNLEALFLQLTGRRLRD
ncbi:MAG: ABC transporter ATP-binding protein [Planctomycetota bacterium]|jgi:ABC-2 type transport system ATP-binding protein